MLYDNIEFHNISELNHNVHTNEMALRRFPESLRLNKNMNDRAKFIMKYSIASEIRFVTEAPVIHLYLEDISGDSDILIFKGDFLIAQQRLHNGVTERIELNVPERFNQVTANTLHRKRFSPNVWRIFFGNNEILYKGIDTMGYSVRPPSSNEKPQKTMLAYGSSITMGSGSSNYYNSYAVQTARLINSDIINLGLSGACFIEQEVADFIANRDDWDIAVFELGVNMRNTYTGKQFRERVDYFLDTIQKKHSDKPIFLISIFPNYANYYVDENLESERNKEFSSILEELHNEFKALNIHFINGSEVLTDFSGLTADLIHPSDSGFYDMAFNLSRIIKERIDWSSNE